VSELVYIGGFSGGIDSRIHEDVPLFRQKEQP